MKKFLIIALVICGKSAFAQKDTVGINVPFVNNTVVYERVFNVPNTTKNLLYSNAALWFAETHPYLAGGETQLQLMDPALSRVVGRIKSATIVYYKVGWNTLYYTITNNLTVQVDCKNDTYRIRIYNIQDKIGTDYVPVDDFMIALINSKHYTIYDTTLKVPDLKEHFQTLNKLVANVLADITNSMLIDNGF